MKTKLDEKSAVRIDELKKTIRGLNQDIVKCETEIKDILASNGADFDGSFVQYYDAQEAVFIFMKVEKQTLVKFGHGIRLEGPAITLDDNPLTFKDMDDELQSASYIDLDCINVSADVLNETSASSIKKISKGDMEYVLKCWAETVKEKLFG